jgi:hypothetical protein
MLSLEHPELAKKEWDILKCKCCNKPSTFPLTFQMWDQSCSFTCCVNRSLLGSWKWGAESVLFPRLRDQFPPGASQHFSPLRLSTGWCKYLVNLCLSPSWTGLWTLTLGSWLNLLGLLLPMYYCGAQSRQHPLISVHSGYVHKGLPYACLPTLTAAHKVVKEHMA